MPGARFETAVDPGDYMLRIASSPLGRAYKQVALDQLGLTPGASVLDLGCGPGADLVGCAAAVGPTGSVVGVDHQVAAVDRARRRTAHLPQVRVVRGDVAAPPFPDGSFDAVRTDRVLQHVHDVPAALAAAARVLRVGGRAVFAEPDWRTLVVDHPEAALSEAFTRYVVEHQVRDARVGSELPRLCTSAGLSVETVLPVTSVFDDAVAADQVLGFHRVSQRAVAAGLMTGDERGRWLDDLATSPFFASVTLFVVVATRPSEPT